MLGKRKWQEGKETQKRPCALQTRQASCLTHLSTSVEDAVPKIQRFEAAQLVSVSIENQVREDNFCMHILIDLFQNRMDPVLDLVLHYRGSRLDLMERTLQWIELVTKHYADSISPTSFPMTGINNDPFLLEIRLDWFKRFCTIDCWGNIFLGSRRKNLGFLADISDEFYQYDVVGEDGKIRLATECLPLNRVLAECIRRMKSKWVAQWNTHEDYEAHVKSLSSTPRKLGNLYEKVIMPRIAKAQKHVEAIYYPEQTFDMSSVPL